MQANVQPYVDLAEKWVLIAEDDDDIREMLNQSLIDLCADSNVKIVLAKDGLEAIEQTRARQFHCVITDLKMPGLGGDQVIKAMHGQMQNSETPTLVISAHAKNEFKEFCDQFRHINVIEKPFEPMKVAQEILRELQLGRLNDRIGIHLLNPFTQGLKSYLKIDLGLSCEVFRPEIKSVGVPAFGDYFSELVLTTGLSRCYFHLGFDDALLKWMSREKKNQGKKSSMSPTPHDLVSEVAHSVVTRISPELQVFMGENPRIGRMTILSPEDIEAVQDLSQVVGVTIRVQTIEGCLFACAFSRVSNRSKTRKTT